MSDEEVILTPDEVQALARINGYELMLALEQLVRVIKAAGIYNLMNGVQLGPVSWCVKANDAMTYAERVLAKARGEP